MAQILAINIFCFLTTSFLRDLLVIEHNFDMIHCADWIINLCHDLSDKAGRDCGGEYL